MVCLNDTLLILNFFGALLRGISFSFGNANHFRFTISDHGCKDAFNQLALVPSLFILETYVNLQISHLILLNTTVTLDIKETMQNIVLYLANANQNTQK